MVNLARALDTDPTTAAAERLRAPYRCPRTGAPLTWEDARVTAGSSGPSYPIAAGVPLFHAWPFDASAPSLARAGRALELAPELGWRRALHEAYGADDPEVAYVTDDRFGAIDAVLAVDHTTRVLEIGCSMGQHTVGLAKRAASVHALELTPALAGFAQLRCAQEGLDNVSVASGGDDVSLPYATESFDLVVLNLVLEWCGGASSEPHEVVQGRLLSNIARVLAPGGRAFVSTKNRYALHYLTGHPDEHLDRLPFGSALPRALGSALLARRGRERAAGHLHSYRSLERLLLRSGFSAAEGYWATPEMRRPSELVPVDAGAIRRARSRPGLRHGATRLYETVLPRVPAELVRHVTPGLTFVAKK